AQLRALPRPRLRPLALRHRHVGQARRARGPRHAAARRALAPGEHHRLALRRLARGARRRPRPSHPRARLRHRARHALLRRPGPVPGGIHGRFMSASSPSVIVVGAGVVGAACAEALAEAGCRVSVLEAAFPGAGATGAAMGHLVVMDDSEAQFALTAYSRRVWTEGGPSLPADVEDDPCGTLWVAADDEELAHCRKKADYYEAHGERVELLAPRGGGEPGAQAGPGARGG